MPGSSSKTGTLFSSSSATGGVAGMRVTESWLHDVSFLSSSLHRASKSGLPGGVLCLSSSRGFFSSRRCGSASGAAGEPLPRVIVVVVVVVVAAAGAALGRFAARGIVVLFPRRAPCFLRVEPPLRGPFFPDSSPHPRQRRQQRQRQPHSASKRKSPAKQEGESFGGQNSAAREKFRTGDAGEVMRMRHATFTLTKTRVHWRCPTPLC